MAIDTSMHAGPAAQGQGSPVAALLLDGGNYRDSEIPIIERGEGPYLFDTHGKRYLDMLKRALYRCAMERLWPLSEADCYTRLYGQRDPTVTIVARESRVDPGPDLTGDEIREAFDARLETRQAFGSVDVEAA